MPGTATDKTDQEAVEKRSLLSLRRRVYDVMEVGHGVVWESYLFDSFIVTLILLNVAAFIAETVPSVAAAYGSELYAFEVFSVAVFTCEYLLRLWTAVEVPYLSRMPAWKARATFAARPSQIIDLLAILPFYLSQFLSIDLRVLRVLRLLRFLKLSRYSPAMYTLIRVISTERRALLGAGLLLVMAVLFAATGMYFIENDAQPDKFGSVPDAAWWAIATLTTVGYGDVAPITPLGRLFGAVTMVCGLCILALPVAIISTGFAQELSRRDFVVTWSLMSRIPLLASLDAKQAGEVMPLLHAHNYPPNVEIAGSSATQDCMYFVAYGKVELVSGDGRQSFGAGDVIGAREMLANDQLGGVCVTTAKCRLLKLHKEDFHRLEARQASIAAAIRSLAGAN